MNSFLYEIIIKDTTTQAIFASFNYRAICGPFFLLKFTHFASLLQIVSLLNLDEIL